ncbi:MAG: PASTA domain-containing protein [Coriobacteriia bacterium]|nr:PASTA domain-containing protein [Coriobacteriia bacterium]
MKTDLTLKELLELPAIERERPPSSRMSRDQRVTRAVLAGAVAVMVVVAGAIPLLAVRVRLAPVDSDTIAVQPATNVPAVVGMSEDDAQRALEELNLVVRIAYESNPDRVGEVVSVNPGVGSVIRSGEVVVLHVGAPRSEVPLVRYDLSGHTIAIVATNAIENDIALRLASLFRAAGASTVTFESIAEDTSEDGTFDAIVIIGNYIDEPIDDARHNDNIARAIYLGVARNLSGE